MRGMSPRALLLVVAVASAPSCKESGPAAVPPAARATAAVAEVRTAPGKGGKAAPGKAEVELFGTLDATRVHGEKVILYVSQEPCGEVAVTVLATLVPPNPGPPTFFLEFFPAQGATGYLCAVMLDAKGEVVGAAEHPKNPLTFKGEGEVVFEKISLTLEPVNPPRPRPRL